MPKCDFNKVVKQTIEITLSHGCSPVNLLHIFRTPFRRNTYRGLPLLIGTILSIKYIINSMVKTAKKNKPGIRSLIITHIKLQYAIF